MYTSSSDCSPFFTSLFQFGFSPQTVSQSSTWTGNDTDARRIAPRRIAVPRPGTSPSFGDVFGLASAAALVGQRVAALCMCEHIFHDWQRRLTERAIATPRLDLLDGYSASPTDWAEFFAHHTYDVTIFHGIGSALATHDLPLCHAEKLVNAIPAGLIVLA